MSRICRERERGRKKKRKICYYKNHLRYIDTRRHVSPQKHQIMKHLNRHKLCRLVWANSHRLCQRQKFSCSSGQESTGDASDLHIELEEALATPPRPPPSNVSYSKELCWSTHPWRSQDCLLHADEKNLWKLAKCAPHKSSANSFGNKQNPNAFAEMRDESSKLQGSIWSCPKYCGVSVCSLHVQGY